MYGLQQYCTSQSPFQTIRNQAKCMLEISYLESAYVRLCRVCVSMCCVHVCVCLCKYAHANTHARHAQRCAFNIASAATGKQSLTPSSGYHYQRCSEDQGTVWWLVTFQHQAQKRSSPETSCAVCQLHDDVIYCHRLPRSPPWHTSNNVHIMLIIIIITGSSNNC